MTSTSTVLAQTTFTIPYTTVTITDVSEVMTISVSTSDILAVGVYKVSIYGKLIGTNANSKAVLWGDHFTITVTDPCT